MSFILLLGVQWALYFAIDRFLKLWNHWLRKGLQTVVVTVLIFAFYAVIYANYRYVPDNDDLTRCGLPALVVFVYFLGGVFIFFVSHLVYYCTKFYDN